MKIQKLVHEVVKYLLYNLEFLISNEGMSPLNQG